MENLIGLDTNILAYSLDPTFVEHSDAKKAVLALDEWAVNATVIHECYHTLAFRRKMSPLDCKLKLLEFLKDSRTAFLNLTRSTCVLALDVATKAELGGRDSLIIGCYMYHRIPEIYSHDKELVKLRKVALKGRETTISDPLK